MFSDFHLRVIAQDMFMNIICNMYSKIEFLKWLPYLPGANGLNLVLFAEFCGQTMLDQVQIKMDLRKFIITMYLTPVVLARKAPDPLDPWEAVEKVGLLRL